MTTRVDANTEDSTPSDDGKVEETTPTTPDVPDFIADKFKDAENPLEAQAKAYAEAEKKLHEKTPETPAPATEAGDAPSSETHPLTALINEVAKTVESGEPVTEEQYNQFQEAGVPKDMVDSYVNQAGTASAEVVAGIHGAAGGAEAYADMMDWASANLSAEQKQEYNNAIKAGQGAEAAKALRSAYEASEGVPPGQQYAGGTGSSDGPKPYESTAQMRADMSDPKYAADPAFRAQVEARLRVSKNL